MKNLKIRFIKEDSNYLLMRKRWWGWNFCHISSDGDIIVKDKNKERCLNKYLHQKGECKQYTNITEYPTIKKY